MKLKTALAAAALLVCIGASPAAAECMGLRGPSAPIICADPALRAQEAQVQALSATLQQVDPTELPGQTNDGWRKAHEQCEDANCARFSYDYRISRLQEMIGIARQAAWKPSPPARPAAPESVTSATVQTAPASSAAVTTGSNDLNATAPLESASPPPPVSEAVSSESQVPALGAAQPVPAVAPPSRTSPADSGASIVFGWIVLILAALYCLPSVVAFARGHAYRWVILAINLVVGWTLLGWVGSMVWAIWPSEKVLLDPILGSVTGTGARNSGDVLGEADVSRRQAHQQARTASGQLTSDQLDQLERLGRLKEQGVLTDEEFARQRAAIMA